jgi:hypothetical protein
MIASGPGNTRPVTVETHQVGLLSAGSADLKNLARPFRMTHDVAHARGAGLRRLPPCAHLLRVRLRHARVLSARVVMWTNRAAISGLFGSAAQAARQAVGQSAG